jgi:D-alanyl-D-alanine carboxypeptidase (penicillin-binding protein 5/6)
MNLFGAIGLLLTLVGMNVFPAKNIAQPKISPDKPVTKIEYVKQPVRKTGASELVIGASSALVYDIDSGNIMFEKNPDSQRPIASINKLMTALVIMDSHKPNEVVRVGVLPELGTYDQKIGIKEGEEFELGELLKATLIQSANDAANALAVYDSGSIEKFAEKMNQKAQQWGLKNSRYSNASGLEGGDDYSSARDVLTLGNLLYQNKAFQKIVATRSEYIGNLAGKDYLLSTTNKILGQGGVIGMKTGYTLKAGECLATVTERDGHRIITVVLDSPDRFQETKNMLNWSFNNYIWQ